MASEPRYLEEATKRSLIKRTRKQRTGRINMNWKVSGAGDLPLAGRKREWDGDRAERSIFRWAGWEADPDPGKARKAFFAYDADEPENKTAYKLPFAEVVGGRLKAVPRGIFAVAQILEGARSGVDLPPDVVRSVRRKVTAYYRKMGEDPPWKTGKM